MTLDRKAGFGIIFLLVLAIFGSVVFWQAQQGSGARDAPDFSATTLDGKAIALSDFSGRPVLLSFWATSCVSCVREIPELVELHETFSPAGFEIVAIALSYDNERHVRALREQREMPYRVVYDADDRVASTYGGVRLTPTTFLVSPDGRITYQKLGDPDFDEIRRQLERWTS